MVIFMNPKVEKLREEREKNREKIEKLTARNRVIDETVRNLENTDIIGLVREQGLSHAGGAACLHESVPSVGKYTEKGGTP